MEQNVKAKRAVEFAENQVDEIIQNQTNLKFFKIETQSIIAGTKEVLRSVGLSEFKIYNYLKDLTIRIDNHEVKLKTKIKNTI